MFKVLAFIILIGCTQHSHNTKMPVETELQAGFRVAQYSDIYFSGQPTDEQLKSLKKQGFATIVNLRNESEDGQKDMQRKVEAAGLTFVRVPMSGKAKLTDEKVSEVTKAVVKHRPKGKVLVHCASGNRAGLWAGAHFYKDHKYSKADSMAVAKKAKLTMPAVQKVLEEYLAN